MEANEKISSIDQEKIKAIIDFIRDNSAKGKFTKDVDLLSEPLGLTDSNISELIDGIRSSTEYTDIVELRGKQQRYLYSKNEMVDNYAKMVFRIEENDLLKLVVETVRYDSEVYPKPTSINIFIDHPFNFSKDVLDDIYKQIRENQEYNDIKQTIASNGSIYLYSDKHLTDGHAEALAEWIEIGQFQNP
jgi:hypothetical protein